MNKYGININYLCTISIKLSLSMLFSFIFDFERELHTHSGGACTQFSLITSLYCFFVLLVNNRYKNWRYNIVTDTDIEQGTQI